MEVEAVNWVANLAENNKKYYQKSFKSKKLFQIYVFLQILENIFIS